MNFEKAHKELLSGKKIRRKEWEELMHLCMKDGCVIAYRGEYSNFYEHTNFLISEKWKVVDGDGKELSFIEALEELRNKKAITRDEWAGDCYVFVDKGNLALCRPVEFPFMPSFQEMNANDWEIMK